MRQLPEMNPPLGETLGQSERCIGDLSDNQLGKPTLGHTFSHDCCLLICPLRPDFDLVVRQNKSD